MTTTFGLYEKEHNAEQVIEQLVKKGFDRADIHIFRDDGPSGSAEKGANFHDELPNRTGSFADKDQGSSDPLIPALMDIGLPQKDAQRGAQQIRLGKILVAVNTKNGNQQQAHDILHSNPEVERAEETMQTYVSDMAAVVRHISEAIKRQIDDERANNYTEAYTIIRRVDTVLKRQQDVIEQRLSTLGEPQESGLKKVVGAVTGAVAGIYDKVREDRVSRMLRDDYTALSLAAISYTMLHTTALAEKDTATADIARDHLMDLTPLLVQISKNIPEVVAQELRDQGKIIDASIASRAVTNTQRAWKPEHTG